MALTTMNRNLALAMLLAAMLFTHSATLAAILAYGILMLLVSFAIAAWLRRSTRPVAAGGVAGES
jgi:multisubunit Na+/H+ antiporter MnhF subunit